MHMASGDKVKVKGHATVLAGEGCNRNNSFSFLQLEEFLKSHDSRLPLPEATGEDTIFEYVVDEKGRWEHWHNRVSFSLLGSTQ